MSRELSRLFLTGLLLLLLPGCSKPHPLSDEAYIWQQVQTEAVDRAVARAGPTLNGFSLHAADVSFQGQDAKVTRFDLPWKAVAATGKRVGIVIRTPFAEGGLGDSSRQVATISELIHSLDKTAQQAGVHCAEVQIDYDCPESKLALYAQFLIALKASSREAPIVFTALPSWLRSPHFRALARAAGGYVLQVHSLELPQRKDSTTIICDVNKAKAAIAEAEKVGVPFRVALPTYRCIVLLDHEGNRIDVISEGGAPSIAEGVRMVPGSADPEQLANLVAELKAHHSPLLTGVIWYRLPVDTDRMNWSWLTFLAVSAGRQPASRLEVSLIPHSEGYSTIEIHNDGEKPEPLPKSIFVHWRSGIFEAADALNGYRADVHPDQRSCELVLEKQTLFDLPPAKNLTAGWIRLRNGASVEVLWK